ncbi:MAG: iron uptake porin, partial [Microcystaceae cyanobacterium]
ANPNARNPAQGKTPVDQIATLSSRVRLNFDTSFTGKDLLRTRIQAGTIPNLGGPTGTNMARLGTDGSRDLNAAFIEKVFYRSKLGDNLTFWVGGAGLNLDDVFNVYNPYLASAETGALSRFARYNPLVFRGPEGTGTAFKYDFSKNFNVIATYLAGGGLSDDFNNTRAGKPSANNGLFNGEFSAGAQLNYQATDTLGFGFTYLHSYFVDDNPFVNSSGQAVATPSRSVNVTSSTGSRVASNPFFGAPTTRDSYGLSGNWKISNNINLSATGVYASLGATGFDSAAPGDYRTGSADLWSWNAGLSVLDLGKEGAVLSVTGGLMPYAPYVSNLPGDPI